MNVDGINVERMATNSEQQQYDKSVPILRVKRGSCMLSRAFSAIMTVRIIKALQHGKQIAITIKDMRHAWHSALA
jgi:hypothetical protein